MPKVAIVLSGCGHRDGAEIRESVLALLYLDEQGADVEIFAPDMQQTVINHASGAPMSEKRNVLVEAARIARGKIQDLKTLNPAQFDALVLPGGFGVAQNLSSFAEKGAAAEILPEFKKAVEGFLAAKKPIGAICIAPAVLAAIAKNKGVALTIGEDKGTAALIEELGNRHKICATECSVSDETHRVVSCSAYMREDRLAKVAQGIRDVVTKLLAMCKEKKQAA